MTAASPGRASAPAAERGCAAPPPTPRGHPTSAEREGVSRSTEKTQPDSRAASGRRGAALPERTSFAAPSGPRVASPLQLQGELVGLRRPAPTTVDVAAVSSRHRDESDEAYGSKMNVARVAPARVRTPRRRQLSLMSPASETAGDEGPGALSPASARIRMMLTPRNARRERGNQILAATSASP